MYPETKTLSNEDMRRIQRGDILSSREKAFTEEIADKTFYSREQIPKIIDYLGEIPALKKVEKIFLKIFFLMALLTKYVFNVRK